MIAVVINSILLARSCNSRCSEIEPVERVGRLESESSDDCLIRSNEPYQLKLFCFILPSQ